MKKHVLAGLVACLGVATALVAAESPAMAGESLSASYYSGNPNGVTFSGCDYGPQGTTVYLYWSDVSEYDCTNGTLNTNVWYGGDAESQDGHGGLCGGNISGSFPLSCSASGSIWICAYSSANGWGQYEMSTSDPGCTE